ncbi:MAG: hypothetical protein Q8S31_02275 [Alphaproteobacteria bacterium]|nr:hypothetical protein [Alphaproteobacteria bacterium]
MLKKICALYFMLLFLCNPSVFATLKYDIFNIKKNHNIYWTDENENKLPINFSIDDIATFKHVGNESYVLYIEKNCNDNDTGIKEKINIKFQLNKLDSNIKIFVRDSITESELNIHVSEHDKNSFLIIDNQDEYNIHFDRNPIHSVSIIFKSINPDESENVDPIDLSFSIFEVKSQLMAPKKSSKNRRKRQKQREKRRLLKEQASSHANVPVPPPPPPLPPLLDLSIRKTYQPVVKKEKKQTDVPKQMVSSIELQGQFDKLKSAKDRELAPQKNDIPKKMFTSMEFQGQLGKLKPAKDRELPPKKQDKSEINLFDALKNGLDSFRQKIKEDESDKTESYSDFSLQSTCNTYSCLSYTFVSAMSAMKKDDAEKYKKDDDTDNDEVEEFAQDEIEDFVLVEDDEIKQVQALKCTDCPKPIQQLDNDAEIIAVDLYGGGLPQQNQTTNEYALDVMTLYPTEELSKDLSDHAESKKKTGLRGILKKAGTAKSKIVGILKNTKKEKPVIQDETLRDDVVVTPRRLSVTHMRNIFETPSGSVSMANSPPNALPKRMLSERPRYSSITHLNAPSNEPKDKLLGFDEGKILQKRTSVKDLKALFEEQPSESLRSKPALPRSVSFQNIKQVDDDTSSKKSLGLKRKIFMKSTLHKNDSKSLEGQKSKTPFIGKEN